MEAALMTNPFKDYVDVAYVARRFNVERQTVRLWARDGRIPSVRMGHGALFFLLTDIEVFVPPLAVMRQAVAQARDGMRLRAELRTQRRLTAGGAVEPQ